MHIQRELRITKYAKSYVFFFLNLDFKRERETEKIENN